jgi:hypothetical protein
LAGRFAWSTERQNGKHETESNDQRIECALHGGELLLRPTAGEADMAAWKPQLLYPVPRGAGHRVPYASPRSCDTLKVIEIVDISNPRTLATSSRERLEYRVARSLPA